MRPPSSRAPPAARARVWAPAAARARGAADRAPAARAGAAGRWAPAAAGAAAGIPRGLSQPFEALKRALSYKPDLLFILSDNITGQGKYEVDQKRLLAEIQAANRGGTKINTIQFLYPDRLSANGMKGTLER